MDVLDLCRYPAETLTDQYQHTERLLIEAYFGHNQVKIVAMPKSIIGEILGTIRTCLVMTRKDERSHTSPLGTRARATLDTGVRARI